MRRSKFRYGRAVFSTGLLLVIGSCRAPESVSQRTRHPQLRIGIDQFAGFAPVYVARERVFPGFDIDVEPIMIMQTAERTSALASGRIDALCTTVDSLLLAAAKGLDLVIVSAVDESRGADGIVVEKRIGSANSLKDRKIAFQEGMPSHFLLLYYLENNGLSRSDILHINMKAEDAGAAFMAGKVDAAVTWEPWLSRAQNSGRGKVLASTADYPGLLVDVIAVRRDILDSRFRDVVALSKGWMRAVDLIRTDPVSTEELMSQQIKIPLSELQDNLKKLKLADAEYNRRFFSPTEKHNIWSLGRKAIQLWQRGGIIDARSRIDPSVWITDRVVNARD